MTIITITIADDRWQALQALAAQLGVLPEDLVRFSVDELLAKPDTAFEAAAAYVLTKNAELYRRLA